MKLEQCSSLNDTAAIIIQTAPLQISGRNISDFYSNFSIIIDGRIAINGSLAAWSCGQIRNADIFEPLRWTLKLEGDQIADIFWNRHCIFIGALRAEHIRNELVHPLLVRLRGHNLVVLQREPIHHSEYGIDRHHPFIVFPPLTIHFLLNFHDFHHRFAAKKEKLSFIGKCRKWTAVKLDDIVLIVVMLHGQRDTVRASTIQSNAFLNDGMYTVNQQHTVSTEYTL